MAANKIAKLLLSGGKAPALVSSSGRLCFDELGRRAARLSQTLKQDLGYAEGDRIASSLGASCEFENVVLQLAAALGGFGVVTVKTPDALSDAVDAHGCRGVVALQADAAVAAAAVSGDARHHDPITIGDGSGLSQAMRIPFMKQLSRPGELPFSKLIDGPTDADASLSSIATTSSSAEPATYFYNSAKGVSLENLLGQGEAVVEELSLTSSDVLCVPVTLNHSMGMGFGIMAALTSGSSVCFPVQGQSTEEAVREHAATILFADSHTLKTLPPASVAADQPALRGGVCKIGSGESFNEDAARVWAGVELTTVGKPPAKAGGGGHGHAH